MEERINRNLDGVYFRVYRDDKWQNVCFSDLTDEEMGEQLEDKDKDWLERMVVILAKTIREIGDSLDISK